MSVPTGVSPDLLRAAGFELPEDGEQTATLAIDVPLEEVVSLLTEIRDELRKMDRRLHRIEDNTRETFRAVMETAPRGVA